MELLEKLAPYLPYGLKIKAKEGFIYEMGGNILECSHPMTHKNILNETFKTIGDKVILRPMSDLLKEGLYIDHLNIETLSSENYPTDYSEGFSNQIDLFEYIENWVISKSKDYHINFIPNGLIKELLKDHFDLYGMIESGEAIDINTLK